MGRSRMAARRGGRFRELVDRVLPLESTDEPMTSNPRMPVAGAMGFALLGAALVRARRRRRAAQAVR